MKWILLLLLSFNVAAAPKRIDFIFDIDGVLVDRANKETVRHLYPDTKISELKAAGRVLELNGHTYILNKGAEELVEYLSNIPGAKITFFSTGPKDRNIIFLNHFKTNKGKKFIDIAEGRVLSYDQALRVDENGKAHWAELFEREQLNSPIEKNVVSELKPFAGPVKKDLTQIEGLNLERAILIDDRTANAARGQEKNLLKVDLLLTRQEPERVLRFLDGHEQPRVYRNKINEIYHSWSNRLMLTAGLIDEVLKNAKNKKISIAEALFRLQWKKERNGELSYKLLNKPLKLLQKGQAIFLKQNKQFKLNPAGLYYCDYAGIFIK